MPLPHHQIAPGFLTLVKCIISSREAFINRSVIFVLGEDKSHCDRKILTSQMKTFPAVALRIFLALVRASLMSVSGSMMRVYSSHFIVGTFIPSPAREG